MSTCSSYEFRPFVLPLSKSRPLIFLTSKHSLSTRYNFTKPNDESALSLMNAAAVAVLESLPDIRIAYGVSDEYSFVFHRSTDLFERRARYVHFSHLSRKKVCPMFETVRSKASQQREKGTWLTRRLPASLSPP